MKCVICHGDSITTREVQENITKGNDIIRVIIAVPVCNQCGERYYDRRTMQLLEEVGHQPIAANTRLQEVGKVLEWRQAV